jgi:hypothetical protein
MKIKTFNAHRRADNPLEAKIYQVASEWNLKDGLHFHRAIMGVTEMGTPKSYLTYKEEQILFTALQWLGSPVGQSFLRECGFTITLDTANLLMSTPISNESNTILSETKEMTVLSRRPKEERVSYKNNIYFRTEQAEGEYIWSQFNYGDANSDLLESIYQKSVTEQQNISTPTESEILLIEAEKMLIMGKSTPIKHTQGIKYNSDTYSRTEYTDGTFSWKPISYDGDVNENRLEAIYKAKKC